VTQRATKIARGNFFYRNSRGFSLGSQKKKKREEKKNFKIYSHKINEREEIDVNFSRATLQETK
jgi:hypothetical protein